MFLTDYSEMCHIVDTAGSIITTDITDGLEAAGLPLSYPPSP